MILRNSRSYKHGFQPGQKNSRVFVKLDWWGHKDANSSNHGIHWDIEPIAHAI